MNQRKLAIALFVLAVILSISLFSLVSKIETLEDQIMSVSGGNCYIDGECVHEESNYSIPGALGIIGVIGVIFISLIIITKQEVKKPIREEIKKEFTPDDKFNTILTVLDDSEKKVMKIVKEEEGITQATLKFRADMSKTKLSTVLSGLEKKNLITREEKGKTYQIYIKSSHASE
ncbi:MAG: MarR family transcriptional regulator [Nanoarchaeota archaeon]|nr:MarR family transcriptional regulator [Nanoarchaeota archaeon]